MKKSSFECQACGLRSGKWLGKCPNCGAWESFLELTKEQMQVMQEVAKTSTNAAVSIEDVSYDEVSRNKTGEKELDRVLGGGCVDGSLVLVGGSPGVGKSTLLLKIGAYFAKKHNVLYVCAEESLQQIKLRANRLGAVTKNLYLLPEISLESIVAHCAKQDYSYLIVDSIQTVYKEELSSAAGSVSQVREITFELMRLAKTKNITIFIIGHITKDGSIAGPRVLEHMVDTVLYFDGDSQKEIRILRGFKNRFGPTNEIGIFEMTKKGLVSVEQNLSKFFSHSFSRAGSSVAIIMEGSRPLALEVQALVSDCSFGSPKRTCTGFDNNRLNMLLALLEKKLGIAFNASDVFVNVTGGIKITETAADLAIIVAIVSSLRNRPIGEETIFLGEVSLTGDIREVSSLELRLKEAVAQGFKKAVLAKQPSVKLDIKCFITQEVEKLLDWM